MLAMLGSHWSRAAAAAAAVFAFSFAPVSFAQEEQPEAEDEAAKAVWQTAFSAMVHGPTTVKLRDQAELALPEGYGFVPPKEGAALMDTIGNTTDDRFIGLIFPVAEESNWFVTMDYEPSGYIKDDDAKEWDADDLLQTLKDGTEAATSIVATSASLSSRSRAGSRSPRMMRKRTGWCGRWKRARKASRTRTRPSTTTLTCSAGRAMSR